MSKLTSTKVVKKSLFILLLLAFLFTASTAPALTQPQTEIVEADETDVENPSQIIRELDSLDRDLDYFKNSTKDKLLQIDGAIEDIREKQDRLIDLGDKDTLHPVLLALIGAIFGAIGGFLTSLLLDFLSDKKEKEKDRKSNTIDMWKYWNSLSIRESRTNAWRTYYVHAKNSVPVNANKPKDIIANILSAKLKSDYNNQQNKDIISVLRVSDFFRTLHYLKDSQYIDEELSKSYFSETYKKWSDFFSEELKNELKGSELEGVVSKVRKSDWLSK